MSIKVLITGASGLLGRSVLKCFQYEKSLNFECLGLCYSRVKDNLRSCDLNNFEQVNGIIEEYKPNVIVHCAAERKVDVVENRFEDTMKLNVDSTDNLAKISAKLGIFFIYVSTDYVFDGTKPPYKTSDKPNPLNKYGISKAKGEEVTLAASPNHCIVRVPILYSDDQEKVSESAATILFESVKKTNTDCKMDDVQTRYPLHCVDAGRFLVKLVEKKFRGDQHIKGIFHCATEERFTKYEMACLMADLFKLPKVHIIADKSSANSTTPQIRPLDAKLDTSESFQLLDNFEIKMRFRDSIKHALERFA